MGISISQKKKYQNFDYELFENLGTEQDNKLFKDSGADSPIAVMENVA